MLLPLLICLKQSSHRRKQNTSQINVLSKPESYDSIRSANTLTFVTQLHSTSTTWLKYACILINYSHLLIVVAIFSMYILYTCMRAHLFVYMHLFYSKYLIYLLRWLPAQWMLWDGADACSASWAVRLGSTRVPVAWWSRDFKLAPWAVCTERTHSD